MYKAPGNMVRAEHGTRSFNLTLSSVFLNYLETLVSFGDSGKYLFLMSLFGSAASTAFLFIGNNNKMDRSGVAKKDINQLALSLSFLVAGMITALPFIMVPDFVTARAGIFWKVFITMFIWSGTSYCFSFFLRFSTRGLGKINSFVVHSAPVILSLVVIYLALGDIRAGADISRKMRKRHKRLVAIAKLEGSKDQVIPVKWIPDKPPVTLKYYDLIARKEDWPNHAVADYYGIGGVVKVR